MISARMFKIIRFLNQKKESSYKEIGNALDLKERNVRYDIDCINDALSLKGQSEIEKRSKGQLIVPIDLDLNILLPTLEEQQEIVNILDKLLAKYNKIKNLEQQLEKIELLKKAILAKAFRGELGTNNPDEESAENLLKEILAEK